MKLTKFNNLSGINGHNRPVPKGKGNLGSDWTRTGRIFELPDQLGQGPNKFKNRTNKYQTFLIQHSFQKLNCIRWKKAHCWNFTGIRLRYWIGNILLGNIIFDWETSSYNRKPKPFNSLVQTLYSIIQSTFHVGAS